MTTTRQEAENGLVIFLRHCDETGIKPTRPNYRKWRVSDEPHAGHGIDITAVLRHYGTWEEAMRQVAPAHKEWQEVDARDATSGPQLRYSLGARPAAKPEEWWP